MVSTRSASRSGTPASSFTVSTPKNTVVGPGRPRKAYVHTPSLVSLAWLLISLPLVAWDVGYVFGRPHTMPGGWAHKPVWQPYELYGRIDHIYGQKAWESGNGFTGAQSFMNLVETFLYIAYLLMWRANGTVDPRHGGRRVLKGMLAGRAMLLCFAAAVMTLSKTVLYCKLINSVFLALSHCSVEGPWGGFINNFCFSYSGMSEYYGSFGNIGHNDMKTLLFLWVIPK